MRSSSKHFAFLPLFLAACGRIGYGAIAGSPDMPVGDAPPDLPSGPPVGPFGMPQHIDVIGSVDDTDDDPTLTADMLELFFNSNRSGGPGNGDIWVSRRASVGDSWGAPEVVDELSSSSAETTPEIRADGLQIWFASDRAGSANGSLDLWATTRPNRTSPWVTPATRVTELATDQDEIDFTLFPDALQATFSSNRTGGDGDFDVYLASRATTTSPWVVDRRVSELGSANVDGESFAVDTLTLLFRTGSDANLFYVTRPTATSPYDTPPIELMELNSTSGDGDPWLSPDRRTIFFTSSRTGDVEIYFATML